MNIKCIFLEPTNFYDEYYRRYSSGVICPKSKIYHQSMELVNCSSFEKVPTSGTIDIDQTKNNKCECGYEFTEEDACQKFFVHLYINKVDEKMYGLRDAPIGAMWWATWYEGMPEWCGPDGKSLIVKTPDGDWMVDSRASNCTKPNDKVHKCWVRHGIPPNTHVDKKGNTCSAGAGSIGKPKYHGFLHNGELTNC